MVGAGEGGERVLSVCLFGRLGERREDIYQLVLGRRLHNILMRYYVNIFLLRNN